MRREMLNKDQRVPTFLKRGSFLVHPLPLFQQLLDLNQQFRHPVRFDRHLVILVSDRMRTKSVEGGNARRRTRLRDRRRFDLAARFPSQR